jgi:protoporphyrinogen oxidase
MTTLAIMGGGPAGLGVAFYAHRAGMPFVLFEGSSELGGICRTLRCGEHLYDSGPHRFHDRDPEITRDVIGLLGDDLKRVEAPSAILDRGRYIDFPPSPLNAIFAYGVGNAGRIFLDLLRSTLRRRRPAVSFEDFAVRRFGETLAQRILLNYSAKLWGLSPDQLSPDVATRQLQGMTLRSMVNELVVPGSKTEDSFLYPRRGYGQIADALVRALPPESIRTGCEVVSLACENGVVSRIHFSEGRTQEVPGLIVSTLPLPLLVKLLGDALPDEARAAAGRLRFRHLRLLFLRLKSASVSGYATIYIPDRAFCISRISEPKNRSAAMAPDDETSVVVEVPCFRGDAVERLPATEFAERVVGELVALRLMNPLDIIESRQHSMPNAYPVYTINYEKDAYIIRKALASVVNLETIGRAGRFVYSHLHDQLRFGKDYVRQRTGSPGAGSPWAVQPDQRTLAMDPESHLAAGAAESESARQPIR